MNQARRLATSLVIMLIGALWGCGGYEPGDALEGVDIPEGTGAEELPADQVDSIDFHDLVEHDEFEREPAPAPVGDIGTARQAIYMPAGFGSEDGDQTRCDDGNWSGGGCMVPDSRTIKFRIKSSGPESCGAVGTIITDQAALALDYAIGVANSAPNSWNIQRVADAVGVTAHWTIKCTPGGSPGTTTGDYSTADFHSTARGTIKQVQGGTIVIGTASVTSLPAYVNGTQAQRQRVWNNVVRHEVGHAIGFGHKKDAPFSQLMRVSLPQGPTAGVDDAWDNLLQYDADEKHMLDCYKETSPTTPNC